MNVTPDAASPSAGADDAHRRIVILAAAVALAVPVLVLVVRLAHGRWLSFGDYASIEIRTHDVGTRATPLVGPYSRYGWNHPGPLLFYLLAVPYRALGSEGTGLLLGALLLNAAALAVIIVVLWRRGGGAPAAVAGAVIVMLLVRALHVGFVIDPWNPYLIVLPMLAVVLLCWASTDGDASWALPVAVGIGSFVVQSHVGAAIAIVMPLSVALAFLAYDAWRQRRRRALARTVAIAAGVGLLCWLPPLVQQAQPGGGNLGELARFWTTSHAHMSGWSAGARIVNAQLALPAPWFTGNETPNPFTGGVVPGWHVPIALVALAAAFVLAARRHDRQSLRLCVFAAAMVGAALVSADRILDVPYAYIVRWIWIVGALTWIAVLWTFTRAFAERGRAREFATVVLAAAVVVLSVLLVVGSVTTKFPDQTNREHSLVAIAPAARDLFRSLPQPIVVGSGEGLASAIAASAMVALGAHEGIDVREDRDAEIVVGSSHVIDPRAAGSRIIVTEDDAGAEFAGEPGIKLVASYDPLTPAERVEQRALRTHVAFQSAGGFAQAQRWLASHPGDQRRLNYLDTRGPRIDIFLDTNPIN